jgi:predicted transcriptional regulator
MSIVLRTLLVLLFLLGTFINVINISSIDEYMLPELTVIASMRKNLGLTQKELAEEAKVSRSLIAKVESGLANPSFKQTKKIFDTLKRLETIKLVGLDRVKVSAIHNPDVVYVYADELLYLVQERMEKKAYSQLPVKTGEYVCGSITERGISRALLAEKKVDLRKLRVKDVMEQPFPQVAVDTPVHLIIPILQAQQAILTVENGKIKGIVTNSDIGKLFNQCPL